MTGKVADENFASVRRLLQLERLHPSWVAKTGNRTTSGDRWGEWRAL